VKVAATPGNATRWYDPGVALSATNRYYFVAHPDEPIVDVVDVAAPALERIERSIRTDAGASTSATTLGWLALSPDSRRLYVHRWSGFPFEGAPGDTHLQVAAQVPTQVIDVGRWTVSAVDSAAAYVQVSPDGHWLYAFDPPRYATPNGQMPQASNAVGAGLRVLDESGRQVARLLQDQMPLQFAQPGPKRLYVIRPGSDYNASQPYVVPRVGQAIFEMVAYEVGSWREVARRSWQSPIFVDVQPSGT
jgi:hypothetical protein